MNDSRIFTKTLRWAAACVGILTVIAIIVVCVHFSNQQKRAEKTDFALNTFISVTIYGKDPSAKSGEDRKTNEDLAAEAVKMIHSYEKIFSVTDKDSELYRLNSGEIGIDEISEELRHVIDTGVLYGNLTDGAFDITIKPVKVLWDFSGDTARLPDEKDISKALTRVDYRKIYARPEVIDANNSDTDEKRYEIDLGAVAKGFIADRIKDYLKREGVKSAIINLGGNVLCIGNNPDGSEFRVGLRDPFAGEDAASIIETVTVSDKSVVTSGVYERGFEYNGRWYHHILDPATGYPVDNGLVSVSVICDSSETADVLSTSCFCAGLERGSELIREAGAEAYFVKSDGEIIHVGK